jgi:hypothetical protein
MAAANGASHVLKKNDDGEVDWQNDGTLIPLITYCEVGIMY